MIRCDWADLNEELYVKYHDEEWGVCIHDDKKLFELLILEGMQAGLSWITILKKREAYREVLDSFNYKKIVKYNETKIKELLNDKRIIRNKLKIKSIINNAKVFMKIQKEFGSFDNYIWGFVNYKQIQNNFNHIKEIPAKTLLSEKISGNLKQRGMNFVGPTIIYSYMQAIGLVNNHIKKCFRYNELKNKKC